MNRAGLLATATALYLVAAWIVAPGFYDGQIPLQPYNWVCVPPGTPPGYQTPLAGHANIKVINGVSDADSVYTNDGQVVIGFLPGVFDATGQTTVSVDIRPVSPCPNPKGLHFSTNTYQISASAPLMKNANLTLRYSELFPAPSDVYYAPTADGPWVSRGASQQAQPFTIDTTTREFGYFAAGYPSNATRSGGSQILPIAVAVLIVAVLLAGFPLAILRRRRKGGRVEGSDDEKGS